MTVSNNITIIFTFIQCHRSTLCLMFLKLQQWSQIIKTLYNTIPRYYIIIIICWLYSLYNVLVIINSLLILLVLILHGFCLFSPASKSTFIRMYRDIMSLRHKIWRIFVTVYYFMNHLTNSHEFTDSHEYIICL